MEWASGGRRAAARNQRRATSFNGCFGGVDAGQRRIGKHRPAHQEAGLTERMHGRLRTGVARLPGMLPPLTGGWRAAQGSLGGAVAARRR
jgi:hypothetical protein